MLTHDSRDFRYELTGALHRFSRWVAEHPSKVSTTNGVPTPTLMELLVFLEWEKYEEEHGNV
jgi:hypothetical protein